MSVSATLRAGRFGRILPVDWTPIIGGIFGGGVIGAGVSGLVSRLNRKSDAAEKLRADLQTGLEKANDGLGRAHGRIDQLTEMVSKWQEQYYALRESSSLRIIALEAQCEQMEQQCKHLETENAALLVQIASLRKQIDDLTGKMPEEGKHA